MSKNVFAQKAKQDMARSFQPMIWVLLSVMLAVTIGLPFLISGSELLLDREDVAYLNGSWYVPEGALPGSPQSEQTGSASSLILPLELKMPQNRQAMISTVLPADFARPQTICFRDSLQSIELFLGSESIYASDVSSRTPLRIPPASSWHLVRLPAGVDGEVLSVSTNSPYTLMSGSFNPVFYGSKAAVLFHIVINYGAGFAITVLILLVGILMIIVTVMLRESRDYALAYLGFFAIFNSLWMLAESRMLQFFTGNAFLLGSLAYLALILIPIPLLLYIHDTVIRRCRPCYYLACLWFVILFISNIYLQLAGVFDFFEMLIFTHMSMLAVSLFIAGAMIVEHFKYKNPEIKPFVSSITILMVFFLFEIIYFYFGYFQYTSSFIRIGLIVYIFSLGLRSLRKIRKAIDIGRKAELLEDMAYKDFLTGGQNRAAYDRDLLKWQNNDINHGSLLVAIMDVNGLKQINDNFGHAAGDDAICNAYLCIEKAFKPYGSCYRIGGDEFACLIEDCSLRDFEKSVVLFEQKVAKINAATEYEFNIAIGYSGYDLQKHGDLQSFLAHVDSRMYEQKKLQKHGGAQ